MHLTSINFGVVQSGGLLPLVWAIGHNVCRLPHTASSYRSQPATDQWSEQNCDCFQNVVIILIEARVESPWPVTSNYISPLVDFPLWENIHSACHIISLSITSISLYYLLFHYTGLGVSFVRCGLPWAWKQKSTQSADTLTEYERVTLREMSVRRASFLAWFFVDLGSLWDKPDVG